VEAERFRWGVAAAALAIAACLTAATPARAQSEAVVPSTFFGVAPQSTLTAAELERLAQGRVGTLRIFMQWAAIDPTPADDDNWGQIDAIVGAAAQNGITVLPFVFGTPTWVVNGLDGKACPPQTCNLFAPRSPAALAEWQRFLREAVERYGPNGEFFAENPALPMVPITDWQLWNEQNSFSFYEPKVDVNSYANLLTAGSQAVRSVDPNAKILLGGMFGTPEGVDEPKVFAWNYLRRLYRVPGIAAQFDGVAVHPYAARLTKVIEQVKLMHREMVRAHDPAEMWITEIGWSSGTGDNPLERGKRGQASRLRDSMEYLIGHEDAFNIRNVTWFAWRDLGGRPICQWCAKAGLFDAATLAPKPAWRTLMTFTGGS
jgi:hypothetical protein